MYKRQPYEGPRGIKALLDGMKDKLGWEPIIDAGHIIGLVEPTGQGAISLEPGGQFELSGAPHADMHAAAAELHQHLDDCHVVGEPLNIHFLGLGVTPLWSVAEIPAMPKSRYGIMTPYICLLYTSRCV